MPLTTSVETVAEGAILLRLSGRLDALSALEFEPVLLLRAEAPSVSRIILDAEGLDYIASAGLRVLLKAIKALNARQGMLYGVNLGEPIQTVLRMTGLLPHLTLRNSIEECLA